jgi:hypothetical protein
MDRNIDGPCAVKSTILDLPPTRQGDVSSLGSAIPLLLFTKTLGWSKDDTDALVVRVQEELRQKDVQLYSNFYLVMGQKSPQSARK